MPRFHKWETDGEIVGLARKGFSIKNIAAILGKDRRTVLDCLHRYGHKCDNQGRITEKYPVARIIELRKAGTKYREIAAKTGVSLSHVAALIRRATY